jgi:O-antigen ligase/polysaccharide polymerase Wzy-like membrane protein
MFLYAVSLIKFFDRNPLSSQVGPQGPIELALVVIIILTLMLAVWRHDRIMVVTPSAKAFAAFGVIAVASSVFSFYPLLSVAKGLSFVLVCMIAIMASSAFGSARVIKHLYYSITIILAIQLLVKLAGGGPLLDIDDYSGRARLALFGLHPTLLGELSATTLLSSFLLPKKPPLYCQVFLFAMNIVADSRTGCTLLVVVLLAIWLASVRPNPRFVVLLCCCLGSLLALVLWIGMQTNYRLPVDIGLIARPLYGDTVATDIPTLNGRTDVWEAAAPVVAHSTFLGYGLGGSRDVLVNKTSWNWVAGDAHNALIDLILAGGFPAVLIFLLGWAGAARRAWRLRGPLHIGALAIYAYIAGFGIVAPNLTNLQGLSPFLIITIDAMVCAEFSLSRVRRTERKSMLLTEEFRENPAGT